jgi:glycosidase
MFFLAVAAACVWSGALARSGSAPLDPNGAEATRGATQNYNEWIVYHIMVGYFRNGSRENDGFGLRKWMHRNYAGGDLQGILQQVDYLAGLGINAVWLSPIFAAETSHGYDVINYYRIGDAVAVPREPEASLRLFRELVAALHERGIRVILDLPLNHGSRSYDKRNGDPNKRKPRYTRAKQDAEKTWEGWGANYAYWNFDDADTREFLKEVALYWLVDENVDGLRMDYIRGVPHEFWAELYATVKAAKPDAFLFGEAWQDAATQEPNAVDIAEYYKPVDGRRQFDGLLDFPMQITMVDVFARGGSVEQLSFWLERTGALYGGLGTPLYFVDNHDLARFMSWATAPADKRLLAAITFMTALSGANVLFYGTETGLAGGSPQRGFIDNSRVAMPWDDLDMTLIGQISEVLKLRPEHAALADGAEVRLFADETALAMLKTHPDGDVLVGVNMGDAARTVTFDLPNRRSAGYQAEILTGDALPQMDAGGSVTWQLAPVSTTLVALGAGPATD